MIVIQKWSQIGLMWILNVHTVSALESHVWIWRKYRACSDSHSILTPPPYIMLFSDFVLFEKVLNDLLSVLFAGFNITFKLWSSIRVVCYLYFKHVLIGYKILR